MISKVMFEQLLYNSLATVLVSKVEKDYNFTFFDNVINVSESDILHVLKKTDTVYSGKSPSEIVEEINRFGKLYVHLDYKKLMNECEEVVPTEKNKKKEKEVTIRRRK